jgi:hypothetical protein
MDATISEKDRKIIAGLQSPSKSNYSTIFTWKNVYSLLGALILVTILVTLILNVLNGDYSRLEGRITRTTDALSTVVEDVVEFAQNNLASLQNSLGSLLQAPQPEPTAVAEAQSEAPTWAVFHDSGTISAYEWEVPEYTQEMMSNPSLHVPAMEEVSRFTEEGVTFPDYVQKEYVTLETWVLNTQEVRKEVWLDMLNSSHTDYDDEGHAYMVEFYEWRIGVWGTPYYFELHDSETPGYSQLSWTDTNGLNHVELVPLGSFIKIAYGTGAFYFYQKPNGLLSFTYPANGYPLFQVEFIFMEDSFETLIVDSEEPVPYGLLKDIEGSYNFMLHRKWTQNLECPLFLDDSTVCTSLAR